MSAAAEERMLASPSPEEDFFLAAGVGVEEMPAPFAVPRAQNTEEIFFLAALSSAAPETRISENAARGEKTHQGIFPRTRTIASGAMWAKWSGTHQDRSPVWTETVLGPTIYGYDGHGSVRQLTNSAGVVTDRYDYDAFGNLINSTGSTPNNYLFAGEQFDAALGLYYNRARYYNNTTGRFWSMDTFEGGNRDPLSLHKYLYVAGDPANRIDPTGQFDMADIQGALLVGSVLATQALVAVQNVAYSIYFNLYRVPQLVDTVSNALVFTQGTLEAGFVAKNVIEQMASNLQNANGPFSAGPSPMGSDVEDAAGANLERGTQSYDFYDAESQTVIQLKGTRQMSSPQALMGVIKGAIANLDNAPPVVSTRYRNGAPVRIVKADLKVQAAVVAIPTKAPSWNFEVFMQQVEQLEQAEGKVVKIVPSPGLD